MKKLTKEYVLSLYERYLKGETQESLSKDSGNNVFYLFKTRNLKTRTPAQTRELFRNSDYKLNYNFENISNEYEAYIVGFWFADGWICRNQAGLRLKDEDILEKIRDYISKDIPIKNNGKNSILLISSKVVIQNLQNLGCFYRKTYEELKIPQMTNDLIRHFIRGYFDGDGTVFRCEKGKYIKANICSIRKDILNEISEIFANNNIYTSLNKEIRSNKTYKTPQGESNNCQDMYRLFIRKKDSLINLYNYFYKDSNIFLKRKHDIFHNYVNTVLNKETNKSLSV